MGRLTTRRHTFNVCDMISSPTFAAFGRFLAERRVAAGFKHQSGLAKVVGSTQQTVSRWEAGLSRPRIGQMSELATALRLSVEETDTLTRLAGYMASPAVTSFDEPFPVDRLSPESFERFTSDLVSMLFPDADVHRLGDRGHAQEGTDVVATTRDGRKLSFQCKRVEQFGPQKVQAAIAKHSAPADDAYLVLSCIASPAARAVVPNGANWHVWDREDLSRKVRSLPRDNQRRLVRIYFPGQELALLGEPANSAWETPKEFFAAQSHADDVFTHEWPLVGREEALAECASALADPATRVILLSGGGGTGKSRILKHILEQSPPVGWTPLLLTRDGEITKQGLTELGGRKLLLVVDDAHDRADLRVLFEFSALHRDRIKLVLALRPYGVDHVRAQASGFSLVGAAAREVVLKPLTLEQAEQLALEVLTKRNGPKDAAKAIAELTLDSPLATVMAAQVVATEGVSPAFIHNQEVFRRTLLGRFEKVVAGQFAEGSDAVKLRDLLRFVALVQPIAIDDRRLLVAFGDLQGLPEYEVSRLLRVLVQGGVLFKRGNRYRLAPDVLGDYLVEAQCVSASGASTGYAEAVLERAGDAYIENILLNLGRMDWRRTNYQTDASPMLDGVWGKLRATEAYGDPHVKAVKAIAYYQPRRALAFAQSISDRQRYRDDVGEIARYVAFNQRHLAPAANVLWQLGRDDPRALNSHPQHGIRVLSELAEPQPNKPKDYVAEILRFGINLAREPESWTHHYSPFDFLKSVLSTEGHETSSDGRAISFSPFFISPEWAKDLRTQLITVAVETLSDPNTKKAVRAAQLLHDAVRYPMGMFGTSAGKDLINLWTGQFEVTLVMIQQKVAADPLDGVVKFELSRDLAWLSGHGSPKVRKLAKAIASSLRDNLEDRTERVLLDGWGMEDRLANGEGHEKRWGALMAQLRSDLKAAHPDPEGLRHYLEQLLKHIAAVHTESHGAHVLIDSLMDEWPAFAIAVLDNSLTDGGSATARFAGGALARVLRENRERGRAYAAAFWAAKRRDLGWSIGVAYGAQRYDESWANEFDEGILRQLLTSDDEGVVLAGVRALRSVAEGAPALAAKLIVSINIPSAQVADELATIFEFELGTTALPLTALDTAEVVALLGKLEPLPELDGHWLKRFIARISAAYPSECAAFFMRRVEAASEPDAAQRMRPVNHGPWVNSRDERLAFRRSPNAAVLMLEVARWMKEKSTQRGVFSYYARTLFESMFGPVDEEVVAFLGQWLQQAQEQDVLLIAGIVREADEAFVFDFQPFVSELLARANQVSAKTHQLVQSELYAGALSGMRSGTVGEPFPQDLSLKAKAEAILGTLPSYSPAYPLYQAILQHADAAISRSREDGERF